MNVFDLPGPQFLVFYLAFAAVVGALAYAVLWVASRGGGSLPPLLADPFQIACLRGGPLEAARVAVVSLVDRGLLDVQQSRFVATSQRPRGLHPIESAVLANCFNTGGEAAKVLSAASVRQACRAACEKLVRLGLAPTDEAQRGRTLLAALAAILVVGVGIAKLVIAFQRGRSNVAFLIVLIIVAIGFFVWLGRPRWHTGQGKRMLADLRRLLSGRKAAVRGKPSTSEILLFASTFGIAGLTGYSQLQAAYAGGTRPQSSGSGCGSSSCGSSSSGCGGGSGCGGCGSS
jgi:uncharacterized protein (TIGR04222 family)